MIGRFMLPPLHMSAELAAGSAMSSAGASTFVYIGNSGSQDVSIFQLKTNGDLQPIATMDVPGPAKPGGSLPLAVAPDKRFLYVGLRNEPYSVATFSIDPQTGKLAYLGSGPLADSMAYIVTDRSGRFLLGASYSGNKVTVSPIGPDGIVKATQQIVPAGPKAHCILTDASNRYVLHTSLGGGLVHQGKFDSQTGMLTPNDPPAQSVQANAGPRHLVFSPSQDYVYLLNELDGSIYVFPYNLATGTLEKQTQVVSSLPDGFSDKPWAADIHLTPDGKYLYASERSTSTLAAFRVDPEGGALTPVGFYSTAKQPRAFNIDPSGRYLLTLGELSNSLMLHSIDDSSGKLTALKEYPMGKKPNWVEIISLP